VVGDKKCPSYSCFERGKGRVVVEDKTTPSSLHFEQGRVGVVVDNRRPLQPVFQASEG